MAFHPSGAFAYVLHEMGNTIAVHPRDVTTGELHQAIQVVVNSIAIKVFLFIFFFEDGLFFVIDRCDLHK